MMMNTEETQKLKKAAEEYNTLCAVYLQHVRKYSMQALLILDQKFDQYVKFKNPQKREIDESSSHLMQTIFYCIRMTLHIPIPVEHETHLFDIISKYTLHVDEGTLPMVSHQYIAIKNESFRLVYTLTVSELTSHLRPVVITCFARSLLSIPDTHSEIIVEEVAILEQLLVGWHAQKDRGNIAAFDPTEIEGICLLMFCHRKTVR